MEVKVQWPNVLRFRLGCAVLHGTMDTAASHVHVHVRSLP
jgi:hypothetical protein